MPIPEIWPTPGNPDTRVRVSRIDILRPVSDPPILRVEFQEAIEVGTSAFYKDRGDLLASVGFMEALADPDLQEAAAAVASGLEQIAYTLYVRRKAEIEGA